MSTLRRFLGTLALGVVIIAAAIAAGVVFASIRPSAPVGGSGIAADGGAQGRPYPGDPNAEASLVAAEEERLDVVKDVGSLVPSQVTWFDGGPYRVPTAPATTLVLPASAEPYTVADLQALAPETFVAQADGSYLLSENLVTLPGATLDLTSEGPTTVRMLSTQGVFTSIVAIGSSLRLNGAPDAPAALTSFDPSTGSPDTDTADGRAYLRVIGGTVDLRQVAFSDLGFWSGETGGVALTGAASAAQPAPLGDGDAADGAPTLSQDEVNGLVAEEQPDPGPTTGVISSVTSTGNAFGLFASTTTKLAISGLRVQDSLVDGIVLHRAVTDSSIEATESSGNAVDGIVIDRSSSAISLTSVTASGNGRNGISIDGRPLAEGPTAGGTPVSQSGQVQVQDSTIADNARYGIQVNGGATISISGSDFRANVVGLALDHDATGVDVAKNTFEGQERQSISVRGGVDQTTIHENRFASVDTGVRIADASAAVEDNTFRDISNHAVTLVGTATGASVTGNTAAGNGSAAIHDAAVGGYVAGNDTEHWREAVTPDSVLHLFAQPLTLVWVGLGMLLLITAITGYRMRPSRDRWNRTPLTELSRGIVPVEHVRGRNR
ncbi:right-handed parallel beta-helix repeat-containing protein [Agromyces sp. NPDC057865]|uniref:right-handed parallel beta-helix repeat-containing protein n=1 Tax=Agromyces sp. NPDC057865 TaxID=3346267 RepID=UPI00366C66CA